MQSPCFLAGDSLLGIPTATALSHRFLSFNLPAPLRIAAASHRSVQLVVSCNFRGGRGSKSKKLASQKPGVPKGKENVWSVDNEMAAEAEKERESGRGGKKGKRVKTMAKKRSSDGRVVVTGAMLVEIETVLQTQEPVLRPSWPTFASSLSGVWKGVGAVFSPITAEMEPVDVGTKSEYLYDCYTLSRIMEVPSSSGWHASQIQRKINWVTLNPYGELVHQNSEGKVSNGESKEGEVAKYVPPEFESYDFMSSDVMEEDIMAMEPGLVFFEDGSYSRGPVEIPVGELQNSDVPPTFKFEQCLVKGCHKRLRIIHTIDFNNGGADIQIMRVAVYEEEWVGTANLDDQSDGDFDVKLFSQRRRTRPSQLTGAWKVFEVSATPIFDEDPTLQESGEMLYVYLCTETIKKRSLPDNVVHFGEEEKSDMQDATVLWMTGGVTGYVDIDKEGTLCIGVGWYSDEGINLVMERDYGTDGKLKEVRWKSEVKRRLPEAQSQ